LQRDRGKFASNDKKNFYLISRGSVNECVAILRILKLQNIITPVYFEDVYSEFLEIGKMLSGLINNMIKIG
jgi:four helix bundle protein